MVFTSLGFLGFFLLVCLVYYLVPNKFRYLVLLFASYAFYATWNLKFMFLLWSTSTVTYCIGRWSEGKDRKKRLRYLLLSLAFNLGVLFCFKYLTIFCETFIHVVGEVLNLPANEKVGAWWLPLGISFYTFQALSYNLDVYYERTKVERNYGKFLVFVAFFPQLIAGPIERTRDLLPQFSKQVKFSWENINAGFKLVLWGVFKKLVIADQLAFYVDTVFNEPDQWDGFSSLLASVLFVFQLYCDFSAYSDIAKGCSRMLGIHLMDNFEHPFVSKSITEFWRRWHISLSNWLKDYVFTPIMFAFKKMGSKAIYIALFSTFLLCGVWHGAKFNYVVFGLLHATILLLEYRTREMRSKWTSSKFFLYLSWLATFSIVTISLIFFRANTFEDGWMILNQVFSCSYEWDILYKLLGNRMILNSILALFLIVFLWKDMALSKWMKLEQTRLWKEQLYFVLITVFILVFGSNEPINFIYFQF